MPQAQGLALGRARGRSSSVGGDTEAAPWLALARWVGEAGPSPTELGGLALNFSSAPQQLCDCKQVSSPL